MFEHHKINKLKDFFADLNAREQRGVFFYRINGYNEEIAGFIKEYYESAIKSGVVIEGKIPNPDEKNLAYYDEIMGKGFELNEVFISRSLKKWLPRMNDYQNLNVAASLYNTLNRLKAAGKTEAMIKNAYIKFMCWLYYKFERIVNLLGENRLPKILYEGGIGNYELMLIAILSGAGCDVVLLQYDEDAAYMKSDPTLTLSENLKLPNMLKFPKDFSLNKIREDLARDFSRERLYGTKPDYAGCTNAWISGKGLEDIKTAVNLREGMLGSKASNSGRLFYNCFIRINGVEDKVSYSNDLYKLFNEVKACSRNIVVVDAGLLAPAAEEIASIKRQNYKNCEQMLLDLSSSLPPVSDIQLQRLIKKAFIDIILDESGTDGNLSKLMNKAVYLLCWLKRYGAQLFAAYKLPQISCFIHMGACRSKAEVLFIRLLARLPVDVLILKPDLSKNCLVEDKLLYEISYAESLNLEVFPREGSLSMGTAAYHAERELDTLLYQDSGVYREGQYKKASVINLRTMYEEISLLWDEEVKFRPNFSTENDTVNLPVIFAKISGVKDANVGNYWKSLAALITSDSIVVKFARYIDGTDYNPIKAHSTEFFKGGKVQKTKIKNHPAYMYGFLGDAIQDYILDKLQELIDNRTIKGTFENGTEYSIVSLVLNLPREVLRLIQKFDFTKKNPKFIYINTGESIISIEDAVLTAFLNLIGFDIIFFIPTGYKNVENHFNKALLEEHRIGEFIYDLKAPDLDMLKRTVRTNKTAGTKPWYEKIFKRGK